MEFNRRHNRRRFVWVVIVLLLLLLLLCLLVAVVVRARCRWRVATQRRRVLLDEGRWLLEFGRIAGPGPTRWAEETLLLSSRVITCRRGSLVMVMMMRVETVACCWCDRVADVYWAAGVGRRVGAHLQTHGIELQIWGLAGRKTWTSCAIQGLTFSSVLNLNSCSLDGFLTDVAVWRARQASFVSRCSNFVDDMMKTLFERRRGMGGANTLWLWDTSGSFLPGGAPMSSGPKPSSSVPVSTNRMRRPSIT